MRKVGPSRTGVGLWESTPPNGCRYSLLHHHQSPQHRNNTAITYEPRSRAPTIFRRRISRISRIFRIFLVPPPLSSSLPRPESPSPANALVSDCTCCALISTGRRHRLTSKPPHPTVAPERYSLNVLSFFLSRRAIAMASSRNPSFSAVMALLWAVFACLFAAIRADDTNVSATPELDVPEWVGVNGMQLSLSTDDGTWSPLQFTVIPLTASLGLNSSNDQDREVCTRAHAIQHNTTDGPVVMLTPTP